MLQRLLGIILLLCSSMQIYAEGSSFDKTDNEPIRVITTFTILQDMAQRIAGNKAIVESITKLGAEIHDYQPTPKDLQKIQDADLIIYNGLNLEGWFDKFYQDAKSIPAVVVTDGITPIPINVNPDVLVPHMKLIPNPHAWMSPDNGLIYIENIKNALISIDPTNAIIYEENAQSYREEVIALANKMKNRLKDIPANSRWLVTSEGAFSYLAKDFNLQEAYLYPINAEQQVKPQQLVALIDLIKSNSIPVLFSENTTSDRPARTIAEETNALYGGVLYVDSLSEQSGPVPTYLKLLEKTLNTIGEGFEQSAQKEMKN